MSKKPAPQKHTAKETASVHSSHPNRSVEQTMTNSDITSLVEKKVSEALSKQSNQQLQDIGTRLQRLSDGFQGLSRDQTQRIEAIEKAVSGLRQSHDQLEGRLKREFEQVGEEKVRRCQQNTGLEPGPAKYADQAKSSDQLTNRDAGHQEELLKLHQQHHQDMLSVINDCCRKLKSGFTRQNKPYDVSEIHSIIDDFEQKMIGEILSEIQKTNTDEDMNSFAEAFESVKSGKLGQARDDAVKSASLTSDDITAALETFESETTDNWSEELRPSEAKAGADVFYGSGGPVAEEAISKTIGMITGDRGNLYYAEELRRAVDGIISLTDDDQLETKKDSVDLTADAKNYKDIEASLNSMMIIPDDTFDERKKSEVPTDLKSIETKIASDITAPPESFEKDLSAIDALVAAQSSSPGGIARDLASLDAKDTAEQDKGKTPVSSLKEDQGLKSSEAKIATDAKGTTGGQDKQRPLEPKKESGVTKEASGKAKGDASVKQSSSTTKEQVQASQSHGTPAKHEKQPTKEAATPSVAKDSGKKP